MDWESEIKLIESFTFFNEIDLKFNISKWYNAEGNIKKSIYKDKVYYLIEYEPGSDKPKWRKR